MTEDWAPVGVDVSKPSSARIYDYFLGGKDHHPADREAAGRVLEVLPEVGDLARANREFLGRAVRYLVADAGIRQIIDIGTGVPTSPNTHEIAESVAPETRVVYVDNDPIALAHARALLEGSGTDRVRVLDADMRDPDGIMRAPAVQDHLDLTQPVALLLVSMLHFAPDSSDPAGIMARLRAAVADGSYLAFTHITSDAAPAEVMRRVEDVYSNSTSPVAFRTTARIREIVTGFAFREPGVVPVDDWRPEPGQVLCALPWLLAGVGQKATQT